MTRRDLQVRYFVESREEALRRGHADRASFLHEALFTPSALAALERSAAGVVLATFVEEPGIAALVARLAERGIPTDLWLNLPFEQGYWQSKANLGETRAAVERLLGWIEREALCVRSIGLDLEIPIRLMGLLAGKRLGRLARELLWMPRHRHAQEHFDALVAEINRRGRGVELYTMPIASSSAVLRRMLGLLAVPERFGEDPRNRVVSMLYSSFAPLGRERWIEAHLGEREVPAIGIVSADEEFPGVDPPGLSPPLRPPLLGPKELARDLAQVRRVYEKRGARPEVYVFALNGEAVIRKVEWAL